MIDPIYFPNELFKYIDDSMVPNIDIGRYKIGNYGTVIDTKNNRELSKCIYGKGYLGISLHTSNGFVKVLLHRIVAMAFVDGDHTLQVNHKDGDKMNTHFSNFEWVTARENLIHAVETGLNYRGEDKPNAILTNDIVEQVCRLLELGCDYSTIINTLKLPNTFEMNRMLHEIKCKKSWTFISNKYNIPAHKIVNNRLLSNNQVHIICNCIQNNPYISNSELFENANIDVSTPEKYNRMRHCIESIKSKKAYRDISDNYNW